VTRQRHLAIIGFWAICGARAQRGLIPAVVKGSFR
jgi:hypothetical protein